MDQGANAVSVSRLNQPLLNDRPDVVLKSFGHGVQEYRPVLGDSVEVQRRFNLNT